jgi:hypothetical protein
MPRPTKGQKTPGSGIKKGDKHKRTLAEDACHEAGFKPFAMLVELAMGGDVGCLLQLCKHIEPPKKPIEVAVDQENNTIRIIVEDYGNK